MSQIKPRQIKPRALRWTVKEYLRVAELGAFRNQRVELIEGVIVKMPPMLSYHAATIRMSQRNLEDVFGPGHWVRIQMPLQFGRRSAPEPDLAVVVGDAENFLSAHPSTALLIVEVSDSSLYYDRGRKASLYARAGIADYWIVNLVKRQLEVRRNPVADPAQRYGFGYADVTILTKADHVAPLAAPNARIAVAALLP